jgi:hypothetical protein
MTPTVQVTSIAVCDNVRVYTLKAGVWTTLPAGPVQPQTVAADPATGNLFVGDYNSPKIWVYNGSTWGNQWTDASGNYASAGGVAVDASGNLWFDLLKKDLVSVDIFEQVISPPGTPALMKSYGGNNGAAGYLSAYQNNVWCGEFANSGTFFQVTGSGTFSNPHVPTGIAVSSTGQVYGNDSVSLGLVSNGSISNLGTFPGNMANAQSMAWAPNGDLFVVDAQDTGGAQPGHLYVYSAAGGTWSQVADPAGGFSPAGNLYGLAVY